MNQIRVSTLLAAALVCAPSLGHADKERGASATKPARKTATKGSHP